MENSLIRNRKLKNYHIETIAMPAQQQEWSLGHGRSLVPVFSTKNVKCKNILYKMECSGLLLSYKVYDI